MIFEPSDSMETKHRNCNQALKYAKLYKHKKSTRIATITSYKTFGHYN